MKWVIKTVRSAGPDTQKDVSVGDSSMQNSEMRTMMGIIGSIINVTVVGTSSRK